MPLHIGVSFYICLHFAFFSASAAETPNLLRLDVTTINPGGARLLCFKLSLFWSQPVEKRGVREVGYF